MAEIGRRQEVNDPLALNPLRRDTERSLPTYGVRNPMQSAGDAATRQGLSGLNVIDGLQAVAGRVFQQAAQTSQTEGKLLWMQGTTEEEIAATGDKSTMRGWQSMKAANNANEWFMQEAQFIQDQGNQMSPDEYRARLMDSRKQAFEGMSEDPQVREMWAAAFDDLGPRLMGLQTEQHNEFNKQRTTAEFEQMLDGYSKTATDVSTRVNNGSFRISAEQVRTPLLNQSDDDRDYGIRTLLGEAAGEGQQGMAAVAHVIMNRMGSKRWNYKSVKDAVLDAKQFSTWNTGAGGNDPTRWDQNSNQYKLAAQVWDAVTAGNNVDPTGGATHYYAPKGMKGGAAPDWWAEEAKSGQIKVGNHFFAAAGRPGNGPKGELRFTNKGQNQLEGNFKSVLEEVAGEFGGLTINSGYRSPGHNKAVGGAKNSRHMHGDAADIDMTGMSDADRAKLVDSLRGKGAKGFITYKNSPNMLHVDMLDRDGTGKANFMFDKSNENLGRAPAWFQQMAATDDGGTNTQRRGTQVQAIMDNSILKPADRASAVSRVMRRQLDAGDDTLFNDAGGIAALHGMGASPSDIDAVLKAKERFDNEQDKKFDITKERARADFLARVQADEFGSEEELDAAYAEFVAQNNTSDAEAKSLYRQVVADIAKGGDKIVPIEFRSLANKLYAEVEGGAKSPEEAAAEAESWGKENGVKASVTNNIMQSIFSKADAQRKADEQEAKRKFKSVQQQKEVTARVEDALSKGYGLKGMPGQVEITEGTKVSAEKYGIYALKEEAQKAMQTFMQNTITEGASPDQLEAMQAEANRQYYRTVYENLNKQGVYDTDFGNEMRSAVTGDLLDPETKEPRDHVLRAFDVYVQLRENPKVGQEYLAGMIGDTEARTFYETAFANMDGGMDVGSAIMRARHTLDQPQTFERKIAKDAIFRTTAEPEIKKAIAGMTNSDGIIARAFKTQFSAEQRATAESNTALAEAYVHQQANDYRIQNMNIPVKAAVEMAAADLKKNAVIIGSDMVIGNESRGSRLDQVMGLTQFPNSQSMPHQALMEYMKENGETMWPGFYRDNVLRQAARNVGTFGVGTADTPPMRVSYNPMSGDLEITLYKDKDRTIQFGKSEYVDAKKLGDWYRQKIGNGEPGVLFNMWRGAQDNVGDIVQTNREWKKSQDFVDDWMKFAN